MSPSGAPPVTVARDLSRLQAQIVRGLLEAQGITAYLSQEAVGSVIPVDVGAFGQVDVLVSADQADRARQVLDEVAGQLPEDNDAG